MAIVSPSILAADFARLGAELKMINRSEADWLHVDVMDGVFVPNISFGFPLMAESFVFRSADPVATIAELRRL